MRRWLGSAVTLAALLAVPASAAASGTVTLSGTKYVWTGTASSDTLTVVATREVFTGFGEDEVRFQSATPIAEALTECTGNGTTTVTCDRVVTGGAITEIEVRAGSGNDDVTFDDNGDVVFGTCFECVSIPCDFDGQGGADDLDGSDVADLELRGGTGNDEITGGSGNDPIRGDDTDAATADGNDTLNGGAGNDNIQGQGGTDVIDGSSGEDTISGGDGGDTITGGDGSDPSLAGDAGADTITGGDGEDVITGGSEDDTVTAGPENDSVNGGDGTGDRIRYDEPNRGGGVVVDLSTTLGSDGGAGETSEDAIGFERVTGTAQADQITGDGQANVLDGGGGADALAGGGGADTLAGGTEDDVLTGGDGTDALDGGAGADTLDGGADGDTLAGGADADTLDYSARGEALSVTIGAGAGDDGGVTDGPPGARDTVTGVETLLGGSGADILTTAEAAPVVLRGNGGDDALTGGAAGDLLVGGPGADAIDGAGGTDATSYAEPERTEGVTVTLGAGADDGSAFDESPGGQRDSVTGVEVVTGSPFADVLVGDNLPNELLGAGGDDVLQGRGGADVLRGGDGADTSSYAERGADAPVEVSLDGQPGDGAAGEGDDVGADVENATGGAGDDTLTGSEGPNVLEGGGGADTITGAGGVDAFRGGPGDDLLKALDGNAEPVDCGEGAADRVEADASDQLTGCEINALATPVVDGDGDGFSEAQDCNDADPAIRPGAAEIPGNDVDENCDGIRAPFPVIGSTFPNTFRFFARFTRVESLGVRSVPAGGVVAVTCRPPRRPRAGRRSCAFRSRRFEHPSGAALRNLTRLFKRRRMFRGTRIQVSVTAPATIGRRITFTVRPRALPRRAEACLPPGGGVSRCP